MERTLVVCVMIMFVASVSTKCAEAFNLLNASRLEMFVDELPDMPKIKGYDVVNDVPTPTTLQIGMYEIKWKFHRDLPATPVFAFGTSALTATVPGPKIEALSGVDTYVTWTNNLPPKHILPWDPTIPTAIPKKGVPTVVHLHGLIGESESDGHATSWFTHNFEESGPSWTKKTYHYDNKQQPGNLWYHDHALGLTRVNLLAGLVGGYVIRDPIVEEPLGLPTGEFDRTLVIFDREFLRDGKIYMNKTGDNPDIHPQWQPEYFGDVIVVNGKAWPTMTVRRRKYRFRIINASNARFFRFYLSNGLRLIHIGSDSVYLEKPVISKTKLLGPSEIADVVIDFSKSDTDYAILANSANYPFPGGDSPNEFNSKVMKFVINKEKEVDTGRVPNKLIQYASPDFSNIARQRYIVFYEYDDNATGNPTHSFINFKPFDAPATETPKIGTTEIWNIINLTPDNHPLHIHLGLFQVFNQTRLINETQFSDCMLEYEDADKCKVWEHARGQHYQPKEYEKGWKSVYKMMHGVVTQIVVKFAYIHTNHPYAFDATAEPGYVYHCHILDHEDNEMMRPLKLVK